MHTIVAVGRFNSEKTDAVTEVLEKFDSTVGPQIAPLRRRQLYTYSDLCIHLQDWEVTEESQALHTLTADPRFRLLDESLSPYFGEYTARENWDGPTDRPTADRFYLWTADPAADLADTHSTVVVNTQRVEHSPEVSRLFADLDATDFPRTMGTLRRQILLYRGVYLHIQDFPKPDGQGLIDHAFKEADPRFVQICKDLIPIVPPYDAAAGGVATRFYHWAAENAEAEGADADTSVREASRVQQDG